MKKTKEYFYSVVEVDRNTEDIQDIECEKAVRITNLKTRFTCSLFDFADNQNSNIPMTRE